MNSFEMLIGVCKDYINDAFAINEFQHRLEAILLPDECKNTLEKEQYNAANRLEEIQYCYLLEDQKKYAKAVAEELIHATRVIMNKK